MNHDPMCPSLGHGALPLIDLCRCGLIARIRDDERGESGDFCKGWDEGWLTGHAAALRDAVKAVYAVPRIGWPRERVDGKPGDRYEEAVAVDAVVAAIEALEGKP